MKRCLKRYGRSERCICKRLAGHRGRHAARPTASELRAILREAA